jgi:hypothetical protein
MPGETFVALLRLMDMLLPGARYDARSVGNFKIEDGQPYEVTLRINPRTMLGSIDCRPWDPDSALKKPARRTSAGE